MKPTKYFEENPIFRYEDFELTGYQSHPGIKAPVAV